MTSFKMAMIFQARSLAIRQPVIYYNNYNNNNNYKNGARCEIFIINITHIRISLSVNDNEFVV